MKPNVLTALTHEPWNKGKLVGQKPPLKLKDIWAIRVRLKLSNNIRNLALFNLAIDSKLRACDLVKLRVWDISLGEHVAPRAIVMQQKTNALCNLKLMSKHANRWLHGYATNSCALMISFSQAGSTPLCTCRLGNTLG